MKIVSTNIAKPTSFLWQGKEVTTGIYKTPTNTPIYLGKQEVLGDEVSDRRVHGGLYKACYLFSADHYEYWKKLYPQLDWHYGMLGENLSIEGLDELTICVGDIYKIGDALIQITQPREPCFKFAAKFGSQDVLQQFIDHGRPGTYVKVLEEGLVQTGDHLELVEKDNDSVTVAQFFELLYSRVKNQEWLKILVDHESIPVKKRIKLAAFLKNE